MWFLTAALIMSLGSGSTLEEHYTANSLIGSFTKDARSPLKGTSITLTDVVMETQIGKVIFKSAGNDKVICELRSALPMGSGVAAGNTLTVVGKVRGRGALGNVTLD